MDFERSVKRSGLRFAVQIIIAFGTSAALSLAPALATCGGGGGGGGGGLPQPPHPPAPPPPPPAATPPAHQIQQNRPANVGNGVATYNSTALQRRPGAGAYVVAWQHVEKLSDLKPEIVLCWVPSSSAEYTASPLRTCRSLSLRSSCLNMVYADATSEVGQKYCTNEKPPLAVLIGADGSVIEKAAGSKDGALPVEQVEKLAQSEMDRRAAAIDQKLQAAKDKAAAGDSPGAIEDLRAIFMQHCSTAEQKRGAWSELQKLGADLRSAIPQTPKFDTALGARIEDNITSGAEAEQAGSYKKAERYYLAARHLDPGDPVPLRYLGELYRHQMGDWQKARQMFTQILAMESDPLSRSVALQGLGKMTIHDGDFQNGLHLIEEATRTYPLALAYRNLAVYWFSEGDNAKARQYTQQALSIDPEDVYNKIFAATIMAGTGELGDSLKVAGENNGMLCSSYNLAAIYALNGQKEKALQLLRRHFFQYERYRAVRAEEMTEARVDAVFKSISKDPEFLALTSGADGKLTMPAH